jgi:hypothetical protein
MLVWLTVGDLVRRVVGVDESLVEEPTDVWVRRGVVGEGALPAHRDQSGQHRTESVCGLIGAGAGLRRDDSCGVRRVPPEREVDPVA